MDTETDRHSVMLLGQGFAISDDDLFLAYEASVIAFHHF